MKYLDRALGLIIEGMGSGLGIFVMLEFLLRIVGRKLTITFGG